MKILTVTNKAGKHSRFIYSENQMSGFIMHICKLEEQKKRYSVIEVKQIKRLICSYDKTSKTYKKAVVKIEHEEVDE